MLKSIKAPWTNDDVESLKRRQASKKFKPYTCSNGHPDEVLLPTDVGLLCRVDPCGYAQTVVLEADLDFDEDTYNSEVWDALEKTPDFNQRMRQAEADFEAGRGVLYRVADGGLVKVTKKS